jgi:hypothetical protein
MKVGVKSEEKTYRIVGEGDRRVLRLTVEIDIDYLEDPTNRREFDRVGYEVASELHQRYLWRRR